MNKINTSYLFGVFLITTWFLAEAQTPYTWTRKNNPGFNLSYGPSQRLKSRAITINNKGYVIMGIESGVNSRDIWEYDAATDEWTQKANFPGTGRQYPVAASVGSKGYVGLGIDSTGNKRDLWEFDPVANTWLQRASYPGNNIGEVPNFGIGSKLYVGSDLELYAFNPAANQWQIRINLLVGFTRTGFTTFVIGSKGYFGGGCYPGSGMTNSYSAYDTLTNSWTTIASPPNRSLLGSAFVVNDKGYLLLAADAFAGQCNNIDIYGPALFYEYNPVSNTWTQKADYPLSSYAGCAFSIGNFGYYGTGQRSIFDATQSMEFYKYDPSINIWSSTRTLGGYRGTHVAAFSFDNGYKGYFRLGNVFLEYNAVTGIWTRKNDFTTSFDNPNSAFTLSDKGYILLSGSGTTQYTKEVWEYDTTFDSWIQKADFAGNARTGNGYFKANGKGYITGGHISTTYLFDCWEYNAATDVWTQKANVPDTLRYCTSFSIGNNGYILSGTTKRMWEYLPATNTWVQKATFPGQQRNWGSGFAIGDKAYYGIGVPDYKDHWLYDTLTNDWVRLQNFPGSNRAYVTGLTIGDKGYFGFGTGDGDFWEFVPPDSGFFTQGLDEVICTPDTVSVGYFSLKTSFNPGNVFTFQLSDSSGSFINSITLGTIAGNAANGSINIVFPTSLPRGNQFRIRTLSSDPAMIADDNRSNLAIYPTPIVLITPAVAVVCRHSPITLVASGGDTYLWDGGSSLNDTFTVTPVNASTSYTVIVTNGGVCSAEETRTVTGLSENSAGILPNTVTICSGVSTNLTANGNPGSTFLWNTGATTALISVSPVITTTYTVTATLPNGCSASASKTVNVNQGPTVNFNPPVPSVCPGGSITITASGGTSYSWSNGLGSGATKTVSPVSTTTYSVTATGSNSCTKVVTITVTVNSLPAADISPASVTICTGDSATLTASGGNSYSWNNGLGSGDIKTVLPANTTTYTVTVTDANNCTNTASRTVNVVQSLSAVVNTSICQGQSYFFNGTNIATSGTYLDTLFSTSGCDSIVTLTLTVKQGTSGNIALSICQGNTFSFNGQNLSASGLYSDTLINVVGCDSILTLNLTVNNNPTPSISPATVSICNGASASLTASGGTSYTWSNSLGSNTTVSVSPTSTTTYSVTVTDANTCSATTSRTVTVNPLPTAGISPATVTICNGASASLTASGGTSYAWSNSLGSNTTVSVSPTSSTTYSVTVTDANTCSATTSRTVTVNQLPTASISPATVTICNGANALLTASGGINYIWSNSLGSNAIVSVSPISTTIYSVTVTDANICSATTTKTVTVNQPSAFIVNNTICFGTSFQFNGQNLTTAGTYYDTLTNVAGCDSLVTLNLSLNSFASSSFNESICNGETYFFNNQNLNAVGAYKDTLLASSGCDSIVTLNLAVNNNTASSFSHSICLGSSYLFNGQNLTASGSYKDTLPNANGCDSITTLNLAVINALTTMLSDSICDGDTFSFAGNNLTTTGTYRDTLTISTGCDSIVTLNFTVNALPQPIITQSNDTLSTGNYQSYQWLLNGAAINNATSQQLHIIQSGDYRVIVTDANGCNDTSAITNVTTVGVFEIIDDYEVKLYPNPNAGNFILEFSDDVIREIVIADMLGRIVISHMQIQKQMEFSLNEPTAGIYFLRIKEGKQVKNLKFSVVLW